MSLLNLNPFIQDVSNILPLHSTMSLLNLFRLCTVIPLNTSLHSTMSLLNRSPFLKGKPTTGSFTFHNVSIKSIYDASKKKSVSIFTFHNVSIKSAPALGAVTAMNTLHSTMSLLNPRYNITGGNNIYLYIPQCLY